MKKIFTTAIALALCATASYGQRLSDLSVQSIDGPTEMQSGASNTLINLNIAVHNDGPDDLKMGDTIYYLMQIVNDGKVLLQTLNADKLFYRFGSVLTRDVVAGDTFHFVNTFDVNLVWQQTIEVSVIASVIVLNRPDLPLEDQGIFQNNFKTKQGVIWYNEAKWPLDVSEVNKGALSIFPNPSANSATIQFNYVDASTAAVVSVYDMKGALVYTGTQNVGDFSPIEINTSELNNGVYVVKVDNGEVQATSKFVVQH